MVFEVVLSDPHEHRRRVEQRRSDLVGLTVPTWAQVLGRNYQPWDVARDGHRWVVDAGDTEAAMIATHLVLDQ